MSSSHPIGRGRGTNGGDRSPPAMAWVNFAGWNRRHDRRRGGRLGRDDDSSDGLSMTLKRLRWIAIGGLVAFLIAIAVARRTLVPYFSTVGGPLVMDAVVAVGLMVVFGLFFEMVARIHRRLERQKAELEALRVASLHIQGELALDAVLQRIVDQACRLLDARYGAISVLDASRRIVAFVTSGISAEERARIGDPPQGRGVLGIPLDFGQRIRVPDLTQHRESAGFPANHPPMKSLLAVPVVSSGPFRGNLYLAEKRGAAEFGPDDEEVLIRFAATAAVAIDSSHLHERLRSLAVTEERLRIAHEMHDGLAQVLAYVNTKALAAREHLARGKTAEADTQLEQLSQAAREVYADVREGILGLRSSLGEHGQLADVLASYVERWRLQAEIAANFEFASSVALAPQQELQLVRIVQEGLANVRKHSRAKSVRIAIEPIGAPAHGVRLTIEDDGIGFNPAALGRSEFPRFGLATMRERAESVGGSLRFETTPGHGARVVVELPTLAPPGLRYEGEAT